MPALVWSEDFAMDLPLMDETHQEFIDLLAVVEAAPDSTVIPAWQRLVEHTADHFGRENRWMVETRFAAGNCHTVQHKVVLDIIKDGAVKGAAGDLVMVRQMARELADWFPHHAQAMDAALAEHLRRVGYDPVTGIVHQPDALPTEEIHGCGGADMCVTSDAQATPTMADESTV